MMSWVESSSVAYGLLAEIDTDHVTSCMSRVVKDLVEGELLQMSGKVDTEENLYIHKCKQFGRESRLIY